MVAGLLFFGYGAQPLLMLGVGLAGTAALWLALSQLEKPKAPLSIKDKYDHWQAQLQQAQTELKGAIVGGQVPATNRPIAPRTAHRTKTGRTA